MSSLALFDGEHRPVEPRGLRRVDDHYPTPPQLCQALVLALVELGILVDGCRVIEPHVGAGNFVRALSDVATARGERYHLAVHDIDPAAPGYGLRLPGLDMERIPASDWLEAAPALAQLGRSFDLAVGNPPYAIVPPGLRRGKVVAHHHVDATRVVATSVAFVLRTGLFTSSAAQERVAWTMSQRPHYKLAVLPRASFTGGEGKGQFESVVGIWERHHRSTWTLERPLHWTAAACTAGGG